MLTDDDGSPTPATGAFRSRVSDDVVPPTGWLAEPREQHVLIVDGTRWAPNS